VFTCVTSFEKIIIMRRSCEDSELRTVLYNLTIEIQRMWSVKTSVIPVIIIQKIPELHKGEALNQGATENSHIGHCTHTSESTNVKVQ
jgi:hypothetical protein